MSKYIAIDKNGRYFVANIDNPLNDAPIDAVLCANKRANALRYLKPGGRLSVEIKMDGNPIECVFCRDNFVVARIGFPFNWQNICDWLNSES